MLPLVPLRFRAYCRVKQKLIKHLVHQPDTHPVVRHTHTTVNGQTQLRTLNSTKSNNISIDTINLKPYTQQQLRVLSTSKSTTVPVDTDKYKPYTQPQPNDTGSIQWPHTLLQQPLYNTLAIETTCDDTCIAIISSDRRILAHISVSQHAMVKQYGGVHPIDAAQLHIDALPSVLTNVLQHADITDISTQIQCIAVAAAPGMAYSLKAGVDFAKQLSQLHNIPLLGINHVESHAVVASLLDYKLLQQQCLVLLITGGHTEIWLQHSVGNYDILGSTVDDACGECLDKCTRLLLPLITDSDMHMTGKQQAYGAVCEALALHGDPTVYQLTIPYNGQRVCSFSFAGTKTQFQGILTEIKLQYCDNDGKLPIQIICNLAATLQTCIYQQIEQRIINAIRYCKLEHQYPKTLILCGGVACNSFIRNKLTEALLRYGINIVTPPPIWSTDNAIMIGWNGSIKYALGQQDTHDISFEPRMPVGSYINQDMIRNKLERHDSNLKRTNKHRAIMLRKRELKQHLSHAT